MDNPNKMRRLRRRSIFPDGRVPLFVHSHPLEGRMFPHDHDFMEIALVAGGTGMHCSFAGRDPIKAGDALILRPGVWHNYEECRGIELVNCNVGMELLRRDLAAITQDPALHYLLWTGPRSLDRQGIIHLHLSEDAQAVCLHFLREIEQAGTADSALTYTDQLAYLLLLLGRLTRSMGPEFRQAGERTPTLHPAVSEGMRLLREEAAAEWRLPELARQLHIDPSYLVRVFRDATGLSPMAYLARCRAEKAASLLLLTDRPVADIGAEVGWPDPNYFARRFKTSFGLSATEYRARFAAPPDAAEDVNAQDFNPGCVRK